MLDNPEYSINLIATNNELPPEIAKMEFEKTFGRLSRDGKITLESVEVALAMAKASGAKDLAPADQVFQNLDIVPTKPRSEEHTSELQSLMRISYAVFCLKKKKQDKIKKHILTETEQT